MALDPVTALLDVGSRVIDRLWPDPATANAAKLELLKLQQSGELAQITGQLAINQEEAKSTSVFVAGWRPAIGWVCAAALAFQYLVRPLMIGFDLAPHLPALDDTLWQLLFGMLGLGGLRTYEKVRGAEGNR